MDVSSLGHIDVDNAEFQNALMLVNSTSQSFFLTGKAGTGKSTFLKYICQTTKKKHIVLAPTGVAAINAGGSTIHSFFKMPFRPILPNDQDLRPGRIFEFLKFNKDKIKVIEKAELIIIDEISMVRADMVDFIDKVLRVYSRNMRQPFGGKQMIFVGDVFQLEPVVTSDSKQILSMFYPNSFFFSAKVFSEVTLATIELQKVYRQTDDFFVSILDNIRVNNVQSADVERINSRCIPDFKPDENDFIITVATKRDTVDFINTSRLAELDGELFTFKGSISGEFPEASLPTLLSLELKECAQVMFVKNDVEKRWVNGTLGKISRITDDMKIFVSLEDGSELLVEQELWENIRYEYDKEKDKINEVVIGSFKQYPLRLAWAITVHKSQGLTFDKVVVDFSGGVFAGGQAYVALSRCRSLEGLVLKRKLSASDVFVRKEIIEFSKMYNNQIVLDRIMKQSQADHYYAAACLHFDKRDFDSAIESFFKAIHSRYDIERPLAKRLIRKKLNCIRSLEKKNKELKDRLYELQTKHNELADEFFAMGNECVVSIKDYNAAIANFDKAILLNPKHVEAFVRKGVTLFDMGDYCEAEKCFNAAVDLSPTLFKALYNRGKNRVELNNLEGALTDFTRALTQKPRHKHTHELLGNVYSRMGDIEMAMKHWDIARGSYDV